MQLRFPWQNCPGNLKKTKMNKGDILFYAGGGVLFTLMCFLIAWLRGRNKK